MKFANTIAFINPRSGGKHGSKVYVKLCLLLGSEHVFDLTQGGPEPGLRKFRRHENLRVIACGGDGTVGWVHSCIDRIKFLSPPAVVPFPLGTGNDMSRVLGWGANYAGESLMPILESIEEGIPIDMDRWTIGSDPLEEDDLVELQTLICACNKSFSDDYEYTSPQEMDTFSTHTTESAEDEKRLASTSGPSNGPVVANSNSSLNRSTSRGIEKPRSVSPSPSRTQTIAPQDGNSKTPNIPPSWLSQRRLRFHSTSELPVRSTTYSDDCDVPTLREKRKRDKNNKKTENTANTGTETPTTDQDLQSSSPTPEESIVIEISPKKSKKRSKKKKSILNAPSTTPSSPRDFNLDDTMSTATVQSDPPSELDTPTPKLKKRSKKTISSSASDLPHDVPSPAPNMLNASFAAFSTTEGEISQSSTEETSEQVPSPVDTPILPFVTLNGVNDIIAVDFASDSSMPHVLVDAKKEEQSEPSLNSALLQPKGMKYVSSRDVDGRLGAMDRQMGVEVENSPIFDNTSPEPSVGDSDSPAPIESAIVPTLRSQRRKLAQSEGGMELEKPRKPRTKKSKKTRLLTASTGGDSKIQDELETYPCDEGEEACNNDGRTKSGPLPERLDSTSPEMLTENTVSIPPSPSPGSPSVQSNCLEGDEIGMTRLGSEGGELSALANRSGDDTVVDASAIDELALLRTKPETLDLSLKSPFSVSNVLLLPRDSVDLSAPRASLSSSVALKRIPDLESVASTSSIATSSKRSAERKTLVMNNYFSVGVDSMVALEFHNKREAMPSLFPHHVINKAWYGIYGLKHAIMNSWSSSFTAKTPDLRRVMKLALDGAWVEIPKGVEALVFLQIPSYSSGTNVWGDASKTKGQKSAPTVSDGLFEVVGMKGVMHLGALQAGWSSGIRLGQASVATLYNLAVVPVQCDGEPWLLPPCKTTISFHNRSSMLFNIATGAKRFRSVTGLSPPSFGLTPSLTPNDDSEDSQPTPSELNLQTAPPRNGKVTATSSNALITTRTPIPTTPTPNNNTNLLQRDTLFTTQELRTHIRGNGTLPKSTFHDVPPRLRASRQSISNSDFNQKAPIPSTHT